MMLVSAVIPIYKVEDYIERCANSLFSQTYKNMEFIFVDDCSPDKSIDNLCKTIDGYPDLKDRIRIIRHENNRGSSAARNTGIKESHGDLLFFVDADDYVEENAVELLMNKQKESDADIVSGKALRHFRNYDVEMVDPHFNTKEEFVCDLIKYSFNHVLWRRVIRKSLFIDNDIWMKERVNMAEDWQVMTRLAYFAKSIAQIDNIVYHYNSTNENSYVHSLTYINDKNLVLQEQESMEIVRDFFLDKEIVYQDAVHKMEMDFYYSNLKKSVKVGNREVYNHFLSIFKNNYPLFFKTKGGYSPIKSLIIENYWLMRAIALFLNNSLYKRIRFYQLNKTKIVTNH